MLNIFIALQLVKYNAQLLFSESALTNFGVNDLLNLEFLEGVVLSILSVTFKEVDTASLEPSIRPSANIKVIAHNFAAVFLLVISLLKTRNKVGEFGVFPGIFAEVDVKSVL